MKRASREQEIAAMSTSLTTVMAWLDETLQPEKFRDYCPNGLQVEGRPQVQRLATAVIENEAAAVLALRDRINGDFANACRTMLDCKGRVVVLGVGKSGHIGSKIAATLASTGTPAFFVHPAEASHGDLGMITEHDVVLMLSNSGETDEISRILPILKRLGNPMIALTGNPGSTCAM